MRLPLELLAVIFMRALPLSFDRAHGSSGIVLLYHHREIDGVLDGLPGVLLVLVPMCESHFLRRRYLAESQIDRSVGKLVHVPPSHRGAISQVRPEPRHLFARSGREQMRWALK